MGGTKVGILWIQTREEVAPWWWSETVSWLLFLELPFSLKLDFSREKKKSVIETIISRHSLKSLALCVSSTAADNGLFVRLGSSAPK